MKRCLVTGGSDFIGANITRKLLETNNTVHVIVEKNADVWRLHDIEPKIVIHKADLREYVKIEQIVQQVRPDWIFHCVSYEDQINQITDQKLIFELNFYNTVNLVNACKKIGFDCFINTGSSCEYGPKSTPMSEEHVLEPICDYAVAKSASTLFCSKEAALNKLPIYTVRPFSVYGEYENSNHTIPSIIVNGLLGLPIELSWPNHVRDFIYIDDLVDIYMRLAQQKPNDFYVFNAGTSVPSTIKNVVDTTQKLIKQPLLVNWHPKEPHVWEPNTWTANVDLAQLTLAWKSNFSLEEGLEKSIAWFGKNLAAYSSKSNQARLASKLINTAQPH